MAATTANFDSAGFLWRSVWKLLRLRLVIWYGAFRRARLRRKLGIIFLVLLTIGGLAFAFVLSWLLLGFLRSPELAQVAGDLQILLDSIPVLIVAAAFFGVLLTSFGLLLQALYLAGDMDFLLSTPVPIRAVFLAKLLQAILPNFSLILFFALPVLFGLGASQGYSILYYPLALVLFAALALAAAGISSLLVMLIVRVFPARRVAEVLGLFVGLISIICSQSGQLANTENISGQDAARALNALGRLNQPWSPLSWAGRGLVAIGEGHWLAGLGLFLLTVVLAGGIFFLSLGLVERWYFIGWSNVQVSARKKKTSRQESRRAVRANPFTRLAERLISPVVRAIMVKDFLVLRRDLRNLSHLITPFIFGIIYAFTLLRGGGYTPSGSGNAPVWVQQVLENLAVYSNVGISLFVGWSLLSRLAAMGFSQEGQSYWMLKAAPASTRQLLNAKFLVAYLPALVIGWAFLLAISFLQGASLTTTLFSMVVVAFCDAGVTGFNLAFGIVGAKFDWVDPRRMSAGGAGCLGALGGGIFLVISLTLFFGPPVLLGLLGIGEAAGNAVGLVLGGGLSLACAVVPLWLVRERVPLLAEPA